MILSDYQGHFVKVDITNGHLSNMKFDSIDCKTIRTAYLLLSKHKVYKLNVLERKALIQISDEELEVVEYGENLVSLMRIKRKNFHDFEIARDIIAEIGEDCIEVWSEYKETLFKPSSNYIFLRGKFMVGNRGIYLFVLSVDKEDIETIKIEKKLL